MQQPSDLLGVIHRRQPWFPPVLAHRAQATKRPARKLASARDNPADVSVPSKVIQVASDAPLLIATRSPGLGDELRQLHIAGQSRRAF